MSWKIDNGYVGSSPYSELSRVYFKPHLAIPVEYPRKHSTVQ